MQASDVLRLVSGALQDLEPGMEARWKWTGGAADTVGLLDFLNAAVRTVIMHRPDLTAVTESLQLVPGMRQRIPDKALTLIELVRNMGTDGVTPGESIMLADADVLRGMSCNGVTTARAIENYSYDRLVEPRCYFVFPGVAKGADVWAEATYSAIPRTVSSANDSLPLPDTCQSALVHAVLYGILSGDNEGSNMQRGVHHMQAMMQDLELKKATDTTWPVTLKEKA